MLTSPLMAAADKVGMLPSLQRAALSALLWLLPCSGAVTASPAPLPLADIHLHFNWDQEEILDATEAVARLRAGGVVLGVVSSTPTHLALELASASDGLVIPLFSPYLTPAHRDSWHRDPRVLELAAEAIASRRYAGIGELHLWSGMAPDRDNPILSGLLRLAQEHDVPFLLHTEASSTLLFTSLCERWPGVRFLWAHAGGRHPPAELRGVLERCSNAWLDLSVRDPWRYDSLATEAGELSADWIELLLAFPDRIMVGSDPVWSVTRGQSWDEPDEGWDHLQPLLDYHRRWLSQLPQDVIRRIATDNALAFFGR